MVIAYKAFAKEHDFGWDSVSIAGIILGFCKEFYRKELTLQHDEMLEKIRTLRNESENRIMQVRGQTLYHQGLLDAEAALQKEK